MLSLFIGLLTLALVLTSVLLILMVLVQLPKKEAGLGMAFGGATADALFGAGSGTVLSHWTKYAVGIFLVLSLLLSVLRNHDARSSGRNISTELQKSGAVTVPAQPAAGDLTPTAPLSIPVLQATNVPAITTTGVPAATVTAPPAAEVPTAAPVPAPAPAPAPGAGQ